MTTRKSLVKSMFMNILTAGIFATSMTACNDDLSQEPAGNAGVQAESFELMNLEQYSYTVPVKVNVDGDWEVEFKFNDPCNKFCYASPQKGHGPATIKLCMLDNWTESRNEGQMIIRDMSNGGNNQTFHLMQKCNLDNPEYTTAVTRGDDGDTNTGLSMYSQGNRSKAVGYGYDCHKEPGNFTAISLNPIIALVKLEDNEEFDAGARTMPIADCVQHEFSGSSYEELYRDVKVKTNSKVNKGGLAAELKTSFTDTQKSSNSHMFVYTTVDVKLVNAYIEGIDGNTVKDFLTDNAKAAINGGGKYTSDNAGFKQLVEDYGTHLIMSSDLGGRIRYATTVDKSLTENSREATAYAKLSYKNKIVDASSDLDAKLSQKYTSNSSKVYTEVDSWGGNVKVGTNETSVEEWRKSLKVDNSIVVDLGRNEGDLIPLYDLVDDSTPAGQERKARMKEYFETGMSAVMAYDGTSQYVSSDTYKITIPDELMKSDGHFTPHDGTLVYNVIGNNRVLAMICQEYIPQLSNMGTVLTVYPVSNNKVDFSNGRFLGNALYPASRLSWNSEGCKITKDADNRNPERVIYMRGGTIFTKEPLGCEIVETQIKGKFLEGEKSASNVNLIYGERSGLISYKNPWLEGKNFQEYNYPLVKIGNKIWTRENYNGNVPDGPSKHERYGSRIENGECYFSYKALKNAPLPLGWHSAKEEDFKALKSVITSDGYLYDFYDRMKVNGPSGFELKLTGWFTFDWCRDKSGGVASHFYYDYKYCGNGTQAEFLLPEKGHVRIRTDKFDICPNEEEDAYDKCWAMQIRLVMND